jgi:hypothetical protein
MKKALSRISIFTFILILCLSFTSLIFAETTEEDEYIYSLYEFTGADAYLLTQPAVCFVWSAWFAYIYNPNTETWSQEYMYGPYVGSGFCANPETGSIVTAGHMVDVSYVDLKWAVLDAYIFDTYPNDYYNLTDADWNWIYDNYKVEGYDDPEPDREVWVQFNTANSSVPDNPGETFMRAEVVTFSPYEQRDIAILRITPITGRALSSILLGDSSDVSIQDKVTILGYPWSSDIGQDNPLNPTVTTGSISGKVMLGGTQHLQIQGDAREGNSGGPVLGEDGSVIGIISWGTDYSNFYLRPSNDIKGMLGVENKLGQVDELWIKGLIMYNNNHYSEAIDYFDSLLNLSSGHLLAQEYKAKAQSNMGNDVPYVYPGEEASQEKTTPEPAEETAVEAASEETIAEGQEPAEKVDSEPVEENGMNLLTLILIIALPIIFIILVAFIIILLVRRKRIPAQRPEVENKSGEAKAGVKYCSNCGAELKPGQQYCSNCGKKV